LNGEPVTLVQAPVQAVQPIQYVMKEPQYRPAPQFVRVKEADDVNYVKANTGRPVSSPFSSYVIIRQIIYY